MTAALKLRPDREAFDPALDPVGRLLAAWEGAKASPAGCGSIDGVRARRALRLCMDEVREVCERRAGLGAPRLLVLAFLDGAAFWAEQHLAGESAFIPRTTQWVDTAAREIRFWRRK